MPGSKRRLPTESTAGNFGDCKPLSELRIDWGPGYRLYYAMIGRECVLLSAVETNESNSRTLNGRWNISKIIKKGAEPHETQSQHLARRGHCSTAPEGPGFCRRVP